MAHSSKPMSRRKSSLVKRHIFSCAGYSGTGSLPSWILSLCRMIRANEIHKTQWGMRALPTELSDDPWQAINTKQRRYLSNFPASRFTILLFHSRLTGPHGRLVKKGKGLLSQTLQGQ